MPTTYLATLAALLALSTGCTASLANRLADCQNPHPYYLGAPDPTPAQIEKCEERVNTERDSEAQEARDRYECEMESWGAMSGTNQSDRHYGNRVEKLTRLCMKARGY